MVVGPMPTMGGLGRRLKLGTRHDLPAACRRPRAKVLLRPLWRLFRAVTLVLNRADVIGDGVRAPHVMKSWEQS